MNITIIAAITVVLGGNSGIMLEYKAPSDLRFENVQACEEWRAGPNHEESLEVLREMMAKRHPGSTFRITTACAPVPG